MSSPVSITLANSAPAPSVLLRQFTDLVGLEPESPPGTSFTNPGPTAVVDSGPTATDTDLQPMPTQPPTSQIPTDLPTDSRFPPSETFQDPTYITYTSSATWQNPTRIVDPTAGPVTPDQGQGITTTRATSQHPTAIANPTQVEAPLVTPTVEAGDPAATSTSQPSGAGATGQAPAAVAGEFSYTMGSGDNSSPVTAGKDNSTPMSAGESAAEGQTKTSATDVVVGGFTPITGTSFGAQGAKASAPSSGMSKSSPFIAITSPKTVTGGATVAAAASGTIIGSPSAAVIVRCGGMRIPLAVALGVISFLAL
ncbi:hypothetical protein P7C70_g1696, partial [Phenoliferia sp. Uapishka_3]